VSLREEDVSLREGRCLFKRGACEVQVQAENKTMHAFLTGNL